MPNLSERSNTRLLRIQAKFYLLTTLENSYHTKDPLDFSGGNFSIEHIMPQNALNSPAWRTMLGDDCERVYDELINTLGNLTLTAYNPELSDAPFEVKKAHLKGGFNKDYLMLSQALHHTNVWNEATIRNRAEQLAKRALEVWPCPKLDSTVLARYKPSKKKPQAAMRAVTFRTVCAMTHIAPGTKLFAHETGTLLEAEISKTTVSVLPTERSSQAPPVRQHAQRSL